MCALIFKSSHGPDGKNANALASTLARTTAADAPVNYSMYVPQRPELFPSPQWDALLTYPHRLSSWMMGAALIYQYGVRAICT
jgi:hypothetical protein